MEPVNHDSGTILPLPGYLEAARELTRPPRRRAHLRRGAVRLPDRPRRRAGAVRRHARHDDARQDARWRHGAERVRRQPRGDVGRRAARPRGPQRHLQRAPDAGHGRARVPRRQATDPDFYPGLAELEGVVLPGAPGDLRPRRILGLGFSRRGRASASCSGSTTSRGPTTASPPPRHRDGEPLLRPGARGGRVLPRRVAPRLQRRCTPAPTSPRRSSGSSARRRLAARPAGRTPASAETGRDRAAHGSRRSRGRWSSSVASSTSSTASRSGARRSTTSAAPATTRKGRTSSPRRRSKRPELAAIREIAEREGIDLMPTVHLHALFAGGPIEHAIYERCEEPDRRRGRRAPRPADRDHAAAPRRDGHDRGGRPRGRPAGGPARHSSGRTIPIVADVRYPRPRHGADGRAPPTRWSGSRPSRMSTTTRPRPPRWAS